MAQFTRDEIEAAFAAYTRLQEAQDWSAYCDIFEDDAVYVEPFTGSDEAAVGKQAVRERLRKGWEYPLPDIELDVLEMEIAGTSARTRWECRSPGLPGPIRGEDRYEISNGKITRLEVRLLEPEIT